MLSSHRTPSSLPWTRPTDLANLILSFRHPMPEVGIPVYVGRILRVAAPAPPRAVGVLFLQGTVMVNHTGVVAVSPRFAHGIPVRKRRPCGRGCFDPPVPPFDVGLKIR